MNRLGLAVVMVLVVALGLPGIAAAQAGNTPTATEAVAPTATPVLALQVTGLEPREVVNNGSATLSLYGSGFTADCVVRLVGYGLLSTSFINSTAITAVLPAGVTPGTYTLEVSDGIRSASLANALTVRAPTPQPTVTPIPQAPPPGRPILTIRNYTVTPPQVKAGDVFTVTIEIYNNGSRAGENTMAVFPGGTFLPVGDAGHLLWQLPINATATVAQRMRAPETLSSGVHTVEIALGANDWEGNHYDYPDTVPVEVIGKPSSSDYSGKPRIVIENARTAPGVLVPGEPFSLTLALANRGSRTAVNVFAISGSSDMAIPTNGGDTVSTPRIGIDETMTVTLPLMLSTTQAGGRHTLAIKLEYSDYNGGSYADAQNVGVDVDTTLMRQPQLIIASYSTAPEFLAAGDTFTLTLVLANVGGGDAGRLTLALGGEEGTALAPFIPLKSGNVLFVSDVGKGEQVTLARQLLIDGAAEARAYSLPIALAYDDARDTRQQDVQRLSIIVRKRPEIQAAFYRPPDLLMAGQPTALMLEVMNVGRSSVSVSELKAEADGAPLISEGTPFVGPLDPGGSAPLDLVYTPAAEGPATLVISVVYRDDFNQTRVISDTLDLEVQPAPEVNPVGPGGEGPLVPEAERTPETLLQKVGRALRGFFGLGS